MWTIASRNWPAWQQMCREELKVLNSTQGTSLNGYRSKIHGEPLTDSEMEDGESDCISNVQTIVGGAARLSSRAE